MISSIKSIVVFAQNFSNFPKIVERVSSSM